MVRSVALISVLFAVGCGFNGSTDPAKSTIDASGGRPPGGGSGGSGAVDDAAPAVDAMPDAKPDPCNGHDADGDGVCDSDDDWPCGPKPSDLGQDRDLTNQPDGNGRLTLQNIDLSSGGGVHPHAGGGTRLIVVGSDDDFGLSLQYALKDTGCPGNCIDQIEFGLMPDRDGCLFDDVVSKTSGVSGQATAMMTAPSVSAPTTFDLRVHVGRNYACNYNNAHTWYGGAPPSGNTIAKVCVH